jgi:hypothetical protein
MDMMDLEDVVLKLVGPIVAVGETNEDAKRLKNLKVLTELVDRLLMSIHEASHTANRQEASMRAIGTHARGFLDEVAEELK